MSFTAPQRSYVHNGGIVLTFWNSRKTRAQKREDERARLVAMLTIPIEFHFRQEATPRPSSGVVTTGGGRRAKLTNIHAVGGDLIVPGRHPCECQGPHSVVLDIVP